MVCSPVLTHKTGKNGQAKKNIRIPTSSFWAWEVQGVPLVFEVLGLHPTNDYKLHIYNLIPIHILIRSWEPIPNSNQQFPHKKTKTMKDYWWQSWHFQAASMGTPNVRSQPWFPAPRWQVDWTDQAVGTTNWDFLHFLGVIFFGFMKSDSCMFTTYT